MLRNLLARWAGKPTQTANVASAPDEIRRMIKAAAERVSEPALPFDDRGLARPPWEALPDIPRYSIGWRMGGGEDYWLAFHEWFRVQEPEKRKHYIAIYPEPDAWSGFYEQAGLDMAARK